MLLIATISIAILNLLSSLSRFDFFPGWRTFAILIYVRNLLIGFPSCCHWFFWYICLSSRTDTEVHACFSTKGMQLHQRSKLTGVFPSKIWVYWCLPFNFSGPISFWWSKKYFRNLQFSSRKCNFHSCLQLYHI